jgi:hypothetical protein
MNQTITPRKAASLGVLLVAVWLIMLGIWKAVSLIFVTFRELPGSDMGITHTYVTIFMIILWKMLPLILGLALFRQHRALVHWFYGYAELEEERDSWHDTTVLATLLVGLLGLFLTARALGEFCNENQISMWILSIDNKEIADIWASPFWCLPILYPLILGIAFVVGANRIGKSIGRAIDKSLESPTESEEDNSL